MIFLVAAALAGEWVSLHQFGLANWPTGIQYSLEGEYRVPLGQSSNFLLKNNHYGLAAHIDVNPVFTRAGPEFKLEPVAFFDMTLRANGTWFYGTLTALIPLPDPLVPATEEYKQAHKEERLAAWEIRLDANARLKLKAGPVIGVADLEARYHHVKPFSGELRWFWDSTEMINIAAEGWTYNSTQMLVGVVHKGEGDEKLWIGGMGNWNACPATEEVAWRAGPLIWWKPNPKPQVPDIVLGSQVWWKSRFHAPLGPYTFLALRWDSGG